jgi:hypothetical protein
VIEVSRRSVALPWIIYLAYRDLATDTTGHIWLFVDSLQAEETRRLRVRLTLQR